MTVSTVREPADWHSAIRPLVAAALLLALTWSSVLLLKGWKLVWYKQRKPVATTKPELPPVDPMLAKDPDIKDATKTRVVGPLANAIQDPTGSIETGSAELSESATPVRATAPANVDLVKGFRQLPPVRLLKGRIFVTGYLDLPFEVPPHASLPRISGTYRELGGSARNPGLLVLSEQQFRDFLRGNKGDALFRNDGSSGTIDLALSPTYAQGQKYHLLLRNSSRAAVLTEADFTVSFD